MDPHSFAEHWYRCLRALGIRVRGLYATKDTFVSLAMTCGVKPAWLEQQTGVAWATLKKHYGRYMPRQGASEMDKLRELPRRLCPRQKVSSVEPAPDLLTDAFLQHPREEVDQRG